MTSSHAVATIGGSSSRANDMLAYARGNHGCNRRPAMEGNGATCRIPRSLAVHLTSKSLVPALQPTRFRGPSRGSGARCPPWGQHHRTRPPPRPRGAGAWIGAGGLQARVVAATACLGDFHPLVDESIDLAYHGRERRFQPSARYGRGSSRPVTGRCPSDATGGW